MEIAVLVNNLDQTISSNEDGIVKVYSKDEGGWNLVRQMAFQVNNLSSPIFVRDNLKKMIEFLGACKIFVALEVKGIVFTMLDGNKFNVWKVPGEPNGFLDYIYEKEEEEKNKVLKLKEQITPKEISQGNYHIDLKAVMETNEKLSSKQVLLPFLSKNKFENLEIVCTHVPKWFNVEFEKLNLQSNVETIKDGEFKVQVFPKEAV